MTDMPLGPPRVTAWSGVWLRHAPAALLGGLFLYAAGMSAARTPLWFDELLTYHIANLGSPRAVIDALLAKADNHPPLDYLARHLSMSAFGDSALAFRSPSILALLVAAACLYIFVMRRTSVLPALVAFAFPFVTLALKYSYEGRGYAFLLASMCAALLAWQLVAEKQSFARLAFLTVCLSFGPYSHYYGVLNYVPIAVGEAWRCWERRQICWPIVACFVVSLASLGFLVPFAIHASEYAGHFWTKLGPNLLIHAYIKLFENTIPALIASLVAYAALLLFGPPAPAARTASSGIPRHEIAAASALCLLPFLSYGTALFVTHAFTDKYVLNTIIGAALLTAYLVHQLSSGRQRLALLIALSFGLWAAACLGYIAGHTSDRIIANARNDRRVIEQTTLPLVIPSHRFLEDHFYLPAALRSRIYYIDDSKLALEHWGHDTDQRMMRNLKPYAPINVTDLCNFTKVHQRFLLMPGDIGLPMVSKLIAENAEVAIDPASDPKNAILSISLRGSSGC